MSACRPVMTRRAVRRSTAIRLVACTALAAGLAAPLVRRRLRLPPPVVTATAATAPFALCVLVPRSRKRDVAVLCLQMWAYVATYQMPNDDPIELERRVHIDYPVNVDKLIGGGSRRRCGCSARSAGPGGSTAIERTLIWSHWIWFLVPHGTAAFLLLRHRDQLPARRVPALRDVRPRPDRLLGGADRAALVRGRAGADGGRTDARAAAHDGTSTASILEVQLGPALWFPRRESARRDAVPAFRHVSPSRSCPLRDRRRRWSRGLGVREHAGRRARVPGRALRGRSRGRTRTDASSCARGRRSPRRCSGSSPPGCSGSRRGRAREHDGDAPPVAQHAGAGGRARTTRSTRPGSTSRRATSPASRSSSCSRSSRSTSCSRRSPAWRRRGTGSRTAARSGSGSRSSSRSGCSAATCCCSTASSRARPRAG